MRVSDILKFAAVFLAVGQLSVATAAAGDDVFVVARVPVQAQADTATSAKNSAQDRGRRRAMDILLRRIMPEEDWIYLPTLSRFEQAPVLGPTVTEPVTPAVGEGVDPLQAAYDPNNFAPAPPVGDKQAVTITPQDLVALESSFEVYDEKSSSRLYRAFITYRFKPDAVRQLLKAAGLPYSEAQTRTAMVLPVLQTDRGVYLWETNNPWMAAWRSRPYTHELTPMIAPLGDLEDSTTITAQGALDIQPEAMAALASKYGVSQIIVAHARLKQVEGEDQVRVRLINGYRESATVKPEFEIQEGTIEDLLSDITADDSQAVDATAGQAFTAPQDNPASHGSDIYGFRPAPDEDFASEVGEVIATVFTKELSGNFPSLAERMIDTVIADYASEWKQKTLIDHASDALLSATAFFDTLQDWAQIRSALVATPLVGSVQISALSPRGSEMQVRVFGDPQRLQVALENQGITFWTETGDRWLIATPDVASRIRGQRFLRDGRRRSSRGAMNSTADSLGDIAASYDGVHRAGVAARDERQIGYADDAN